MAYVKQNFKKKQILKAEHLNRMEEGISDAVKIAKNAEKNAGKDGYTPVKGVDYFTEEDKAEFEAYINNEIVKLKAEGIQVHALYPEVNDTVENALAWLVENGDTTKVYVLPDGYVYGYMMTEKVVGGCTNLADPTDENWKDGYRLSSSGETAQADTSLSNIFDVKKGDVVRIKGVTLRENNDRIQLFFTRSDTGESVFLADYFQNGISSNNMVSYDGLENGVYTFTMLEDGTHIHTGFRFAMPTPEDASAVIVTVNEEITEGQIVKEYGWANTNHAFIPNEYDDEFVAMNEKINNNEVAIVNLNTSNQALKESLNAVEEQIANIGTTDIPEYWVDYLDGKIATIQNYHNTYGKDCFSFVLMADTHYPSNLGKNSPILARKIMDECDIKYTLHVGDWQTRGCHATKELLLAENEAIKAWFEPIIDDLLLEQGNHDGSYGTSDKDGDGTISNSNTDGTIKAAADRETYVHNLTPQEMHQFAYRKVGMVGNVHFDETGTAYYIDDTSNNVRYIGLNTQCNDYELQDDGTQSYPKMWLMRFTQPQFDFLINEALVEGVTSKTKIVIFAHVPTTQEIGDRDVMNGVLKAFVDKSAYSGSYAGEYGYDAVSVNVDFTGVKGTLVGYFHGHTHVDSLNTANGFNIIGTRCDAKEENDSTLNAEKVAGTVTEQSFDVFTVSTRTRTIHVTKIGAGDDRTITY